MEDIGVGIGDICVKECTIMAILILTVEGSTEYHRNTSEVYGHVQHFNAIQQCAICFGSTEILSGTSFKQV